MQDNKSRYLQNQSINNINRVREDRAVANRNNDLQYAMSRSPEFYQNTDNLRDIKGILASTPAMTTDQNESRNMYQMLMNQMKGGDKGARLIDTRGLPAGATRYGRNLFNDPSKSQGFFGDLNSFRTGKNKAAVRAPEYNPFPEAGFGEEFYEDQFGGFDFGGLMEGIMKIATPLKYLPERDPRAPLERDSSFLPQNNPFDIEFDELDNIASPAEEIYEGSDYNEEIKVTDLPLDQSQSLVYEGNGNEEEIEAIRNQIMSNPATTDFGNLEDLYGIKANTFDPESYIEEQTELGNPPNIETGIFDEEANNLQQNLEEIQMAELTEDQMNMMGNMYNTPALGGVSKEDLYNKTKDMEDTGFFGFGAQEPTTREEFEDYYRKLQQGTVGNWVT